MIYKELFDFYKKCNPILKLLLVGLLIIIALFWFISQFGKIGNIIFFLLAVLIGATLCYYFYDDICNVIQYVMDFLTKMP